MKFLKQVPEAVLINQGWNQTVKIYYAIRTVNFKLNWIITFTATITVETDFNRYFKY